MRILQFDYEEPVSEMLIFEVGSSVMDPRWWDVAAMKRLTAIHAKKPATVAK